MRAFSVYMKHFALLFCTGLVGLWACQSGSDIIGIDSGTATPLNVLLIDTMTVTASTTLSDTIITSGSNVLLVGRSVNAPSGNVLARAFFQPTVTGTYTFSGDANRIQFDSLVLQLRYQGYPATYGDTSQVQQLMLYPLVKKPDPDSVHYNSQQLRWASTPIAVRTYKPRPYTNRDSSVNIRLPNTLGKQLFDQIRTGQLTDNEGLLSLLPGFALIPSMTENGAIVTFSAGASGNRPASQIVMYYHDTDYDVNKYKFAFDILQGNTQFNYIENDRRGTPLAKLKIPRDDVVPSAQTNEETYVQYGAGLRTIYRIPGLDVLKSIPGFADINRAELIVKPLRFDRNNNTPLPQTLALQPVNINNQVNGTLLSYSGQQVASGLLTDFTQVVQSYQYAFTLTNFVSNIAKGTSPNQGLMVAPLNGSDVGLALNRVALGSQRYANKDFRLTFRVYYTTNR